MKRFYFPFFLKLSFLFVFLFSCAAIHAQETFQKSVHFKKNKFVLTDDAKEILDGIKDSVGDFVIDKVIIKGYTDSDADSAYNAKLSERRCQSVKNYLAATGIDSSKFYIAAYGEDFPLVENSDERNKSKNRRVDLIITMRFPVIVKKIPTKKDSCAGDTLIMVSDGVMMLVNKCNVNIVKNCMQVSVQRRVQHQVKVSKFKKKLGFKKYTRTRKRRRFKKFPVTYTYYVRVYCPDSTCRNTKTTFYVPTYQVKEKLVTVRDLDTATGETSKARVPKIKTIKKKTYAAVSAKCPDRGQDGKPCWSMINCGTHFSCDACKPAKLKFKNGIKVLKVNGYASMGITLSKDSDVVTFNPEHGISSLQLLVKGDTISIDYIELNALNHGALHLKSCSDKKWFLFMRIYKRCPPYRKYKFKRKDIKLQQEKPWLDEVE